MKRIWRGVWIASWLAQAAALLTPGPQYFEQRRSEQKTGALKPSHQQASAALVKLPAPPVRAKGPSLVRRILAIAPPGSDKVVHMGVFAVPTAAGLLAGIAPAAVIGTQLTAAPVSEWLQEEFIVGRGGSGKDVAADLGGITLGVLLALAGGWCAGKPRR